MSNRPLNVGLVGRDALLCNILGGHPIA